MGSLITEYHNCQNREDNPTRCSDSNRRTRWQKFCSKSVNIANLTKREAGNAAPMTFKQSYPSVSTRTATPESRLGFFGWNKVRRAGSITYVKRMVCQDTYAKCGLGSEQSNCLHNSSRDPTCPLSVPSQDHPRTLAESRPVDRAPSPHRCFHSLCRI